MASLKKLQAENDYRLQGVSAWIAVGDKVVRIFDFEDNTILLEVYWADHEMEDPDFKLRFKKHG